MLDNEFLEEAISNIENWNYGGLKEIKLLSEDEIKGIAYQVESGDYCDYDIINLCVTALRYLRNKK